MTRAEAMEVLGLAGSSTEEEIRRAYLRLLKTHNPERDQAGFMRVRAAYDVARKQAANVPVGFFAQFTAPPSKPLPPPPPAPPPQAAVDPADFDDTEEEVLEARSAAQGKQAPLDDFDDTEDPDPPNPLWLRWEAIRQQLLRGELRPGATALRRLLELPDADLLELPTGELLAVLLDLHQAGWADLARELHMVVTEWLERSGRSPGGAGDPLLSIQWLVCEELALLDPLAFPVRVRELIISAARAGSILAAEPGLRAFSAAEPDKAQEAYSQLACFAPRLYGLFGPYVCTPAAEVAKAPSAPPKAPEPPPKAPEPPKVTRQSAQELWALARARLEAGDLGAAALLLVRALRDPEAEDAPLDPSWALELLLRLHREQRSTAARGVEASLTEWLLITRKKPFEEEPARTRWLLARELTRLDPLEFPAELRTLLARGVDDPLAVEAQLRAFLAADGLRATVSQKMLKAHAPSFLARHAAFGGAVDGRTPQDHWARAEKLMAKNELQSAAAAVLKALTSPGCEALVANPQTLLHFILQLNREGRAGKASEVCLATERWLEKTGQTLAFSAPPFSLRWAVARELARLDPLGFPSDVRSQMVEALLASDDAARDVTLRAFALANPGVAREAAQKLRAHGGLLDQLFRASLEPAKKQAAAAPAPPPPQKASSSFGRSGWLFAVLALGLVRVCAAVSKPSTYDSSLYKPRIELPRYDPTLYQAPPMLPSSGLRGAGASGARYAQYAKELCAGVERPNTSDRRCGLATEAADALTAHDCPRARRALQQLALDYPLAKRGQLPVSFYMLQASEKVACVGAP